jgi:hypothetical protein
MPVRSNSKHALLRDPDVKRWFDNIARGSPVTADVYLRRLAAFCSDTGQSPRKLSSKNESALHDSMLDYVSQMEEDDKAGSSI